VVKTYGDWAIYEEDKDSVSKETVKEITDLLKSSFENLKGEIIESETIINDYFIHGLKIDGHCTIAVKLIVEE
jgi:methyl coenzyme M reductase subunit D